MSDGSRASELYDDRPGWIEGQIRSAADYVVPSDNLRPRTLEAAREWSEDRKAIRRLRRFAVLLLLCSMMSVPLVEQLTAWHKRSQSPSSLELEQRALQLATDSHIGQHWGLFEAFSQLRRVQAARLGQPASNSSLQ